MQNEILSYRINHLEYKTLEEAKASVGNKVSSWVPKFYNKCIYCGDSLVGLDKYGIQFVEIEFLSNGRSCNAFNYNDNCGYSSP